MDPAMAIKKKYRLGGAVERGREQFCRGVRLELACRHRSIQGALHVSGETIGALVAANDPAVAGTSPWGWFREILRAQRLGRGKGPPNWAISFPVRAGG